MKPYVRHVSDSMVLRRYAVPIPENIAKTSRHPRRPMSEFPKHLVKLRAVSDEQLTDTRIEFTKPRAGDGVLVHAWRSDGDDGHWVIDESHVSACVRDLVSETDFVVECGEDEYLPSAGDEEGGDVEEDVDEDVLDAVLFTVTLDGGETFGEKLGDAS